MKPLTGLLTFLFLVVVSSGVSAAQGDRLRDNTPRQLIDEANTLDELAGLNQQGAAQQIGRDFKDLAGGEANAQLLVRNLREGTQVSLAGTRSGDPGATFAPATGKMGWGNVFIALALANETLKAAGISQPTAAELAAALNGGTVMVNGQTRALTGVLALRASGQGWGQISNGLGVKLGPVISAIKSGNQRLEAKLPERRKAQGTVRDGRQAKGKSDHLDGREHSAQFTGHGERAERSDRPQRPDLAERGNAKGR